MTCRRNDVSNNISGRNGDAKRRKTVRTKSTRTRPKSKLEPQSISHVFYERKIEAGYCPYCLLYNVRIVLSVAIQVVKFCESQKAGKRLKIVSAPLGEYILLLLLNRMDILYLLLFFFFITFCKHFDGMGINL